MFAWQIGTIDAKVSVILDLIAKSEGTSTAPLTRMYGYDVIVTGIVMGPDYAYHVHEETFDDYSTHPFAVTKLRPEGRPPVLVRAHPPLESTASGRYQQLLHNWNVYKTQLRLPDFGPLSQDKMGYQLLKEIRAVEPIMDGDVRATIPLLGLRWASFPTSTAGQPKHSIETLLAWHQEIVDGPHAAPTTITA